MQSTSQALKMQSRSFSLCCCTCSKGYSRPSLPSRRDWVKASQLFSSSSSSSSILWRGYQSTSAAASSASATAATSEATAFRTGESPSSPSTSSKASSASNVGGASEPLSSFFKQSFMRSDPATGAAGKQRATDTPADMTSASSSSTAASLDVPLQNIGRDLAVAIPPIATPTDAWRPLPSASSRSISSYLSIYKQLAKGRLSAWIVLTAMAGYAMCPTDPAAAQLAMDALVQDTFGSTAISSALSNAGDLAPSATSASTSSALNDFRVTTLLATAAGTALCSASANTFNQLIEIPYDAQMPRTAKRPLPSHLISPLHAFTFGSVTAISGVALLYGCVNPLTASLGLLNIILYAGVYTPLKRLSVVNTWIGALVGGIPPLMGWAACTNSLDPFSGQAGAWVLALILFAWQFPHFNSLSWTIRSEYARGGYRMLSALNPAMNARVSLRWTVAGALAAGVAAPMVGLTSWAVGLATLIPSGALGVCAWKFWRAGSKASLQKAKGSGLPAVAPGARATDKDPRDASARSLFFVSLVHLPALLFMMMAGKIWGDYQEKSEASESIEQATRQQCNDGGISHQRVSAIRTTVGDQGTGAGV